MNKRIAIYPGTFDPFTIGHHDIALRACDLFDEVVIAVSDHGRKNVMFDVETRCRMIREIMAGEEKISVAPFTNLVTDCAKAHDAHAIIRGLRVTSDFEYEFRMACYIREMDPSIEVVYLMAQSSTLHIASSLVKEIASLGGDISMYLDRRIEQKVKEYYENN